jgi:hypothetical protein
MIALADTMPLCKDCKHGMNEGQSAYVCSKVQNIVTGHAPPCSDVREDKNLCGQLGSWFERRMSIAAIVDQAPIYTYVKDDGSIHDKRTNQPIAENAKVRAYRPEDVNFDEWKKSD